MEITTMTGMRPTGHLHLGHLYGALASIAALSREGNCFVEIADLHALTGTGEGRGEKFKGITTALECSKNVRCGRESSANAGPTTKKTHPKARQAAKNFTINLFV